MPDQMVVLIQIVLDQAGSALNVEGSVMICAPFAGGSLILKGFDFPAYYGCRYGCEGGTHTIGYRILHELQENDRGRRKVHHL